MNRILLLPLARWATLLLVLLGLSLVLESCAGGRHGSLAQKSRWYKRHKGKSVPCPCGH